MLNEVVTEGASSKQLRRRCRVVCQRLLAVVLHFGLHATFEDAVSGQVLQLVVHEGLRRVLHLDVLALPTHLHGEEFFFHGTFELAVEHLRCLAFENLRVAKFYEDTRRVQVILIDGLVVTVVDPVALHKINAPPLIAQTPLLQGFEALDLQMLVQEPLSHSHTLSLYTAIFSVTLQAQQHFEEHLAVHKLLHLLLGFSLLVNDCFEASTKSVEI